MSTTIHIESPALDPMLKMGSKSLQQCYWLGAYDNGVNLQSTS